MGCKLRDCAEIPPIGVATHPGGPGWLQKCETSYSIHFSRSKFREWAPERFMNKHYIYALKYNYCQLNDVDPAWTKKLI